MARSIAYPLIILWFPASCIFRGNKNDYAEQFRFRILDFDVLLGDNNQCSKRLIDERRVFLAAPIPQIHILVSIVSSVIFIKQAPHSSNSSRLTDTLSG
jgi:hypothetical protein